MPDPRDPSIGAPHLAPGFDLLGHLAEYMDPGSPPRFVLVAGNVGIGKSSLLRALVPRLRGPKAFLAYLPTQASLPDPSSGDDLAMLLVDPQVGTHRDAPPAGDVPPPADNRSNEEWAGAPPPLIEVVRRFSGRGTVIVDSWDRGSEEFFRSQAADSRSVQLFTAPARALSGMRRGLLSTPVHLVIGVTPQAGAPLLSTADALVELHDVQGEVGRVRVVSYRKARGASLPTLPDLLYTIQGGRFRSLPELPKGFRPPVGPAGEDPEEHPTSGWPGSADFAKAFGRFRYGGYTGLTVSRDTPDTLPLMFAIPMATHALRIGGRVVWIPSPAIRPARIVTLLKELLPVDWIRERLRILSASGDDAGLGELRSVVLPLRRDVGEGNELRSALSPGVGPIFPDAFRFLRTRPEGSPALYVMSIEGLRTVAAVAQATIDPVTLPVVFGAYARIPGFHGFGFGAPDDPAAVAVRSAVDTVIHAEMVCGRPVLCGIRPQTPAYLVDWSEPDGSYSLVPQT